MARKRVGGFSLGMSQRLGIAAALLGDPGTLLFDEPVNGLDPDGILWIRTLMRTLAEEGRTVLVSSHLMSEMALTADHLLVIGRGRLLADMPLSELIAQNSAERVEVRAADPSGWRRTCAPPEPRSRWSRTGRWACSGSGRSRSASWPQSAATCCISCAM